MGLLNGRMIDLLSRFVPLRGYEFLLPRRAIGLCYHVVSDRPLPHIRHQYAYKSVRQFERDLIYLQRNYHLVSYPALAAGPARGRRLGKPSVILTFDDGLAECYTVVRELLLKHGVPCTFFVVTDVIDNRKLLQRHKLSLCIERAAELLRAPDGTAALAAAGLPESAALDYASIRRYLRSFYEDDLAVDRLCGALSVDAGEFLAREQPYLSTEQIRQLAADGFTIGAHSRSHPRLGALSAAEIEEEIVGSCRVVHELVGRPGGGVPFAFPYSGHGVSRTLLAALRREHPFVGLFFDTRGVRFENDFILHRVLADDPAGADAASGNLPRLLGRAYATECIRAVRQPFARRAGRIASAPAQPAEISHSPRRAKQ